jgi:predicted RNase H-like nuclease (RuvC/YqgF family)
MRAKKWMKYLVSIAVVCLAGLPLYAQQQSSSQQSGSDPVADAARKAREDKKNAAKPKKVYTDDDVKPAASAATGNTGAAAGATGTTGQQKAGDAAVAQDANGEAAWRKRFKEQRDKISKAETELDILERELQKSQTEYYPDPQKALTEQNTRKEINDKTAKIDAKKQEIAQLKQGQDDLEDQLRKSGGDPGWAR